MWLHIGTQETTSFPDGEASACLLLVTWRWIYLLTVAFPPKQLATSYIFEAPMQRASASLCRVTYRAPFSTWFPFPASNSQLISLFPQIADSPLNTSLVSPYYFAWPENQKKRSRRLKKRQETSRWVFFLGVDVSPKTSCYLLLASKRRCNVPRCLCFLLSSHPLLRAPVAMSYAFQGLIFISIPSSSNSFLSLRFCCYFSL